MYYSPRKQYFFGLCLLIFLASSIGVVELLQKKQKAFYRERVQIEAKEQLSALGSNLEAVIMADIYKISTLATLVTLLPNSREKELQIAANRVLEESKYISVIGIAKNDVVSHVFPYEGNESVKGLDYRKIPEQWMQVQKAKNIRETLIAGPVTLVQEQLGFLVHVPVFLDPPMNNNYWGVVSAAIDFDTLMRESGVIDFSNRYPLTIRGYDSSGSFGDVFFGEFNETKIIYAKETVNFPYGGWEMTAFSHCALEHHVSWYYVYQARLIGYPVVFILGLALFAIYRLYTIADDRALHDELTRLPNRRYFMKSYKQQFEIAKRYKKGYSFALINIDLDKFKNINDSYGHEAGDKVLMATAERIKSTLRKSDIVARIGGDEFLVMVHNAGSEENVQSLVQKIKSVLCSTPVLYESERIYLHCSLGHAVFEPDMLSPEQMMKIADKRMYQQKQRR